VRLDADAALEAHDRFILRALSPVATIGGGSVVDVVSRRWRGRDAHAAYLRALASGDLAVACAVLLAERGPAGVTTDDLGGVGLSAAEVGAAMRGLIERGGADRLTVAGRDHWFAPGTLEEAREALARLAAANAAARPERPFTAPSELAAAVPGLAPEVATALLDGLVDGGRLLAAEGGYAAAGAPGVLSPDQEEVAAEVLGLVAAEPFAPPTLATLAERTGVPARDLARLLDALVRRGDLVRTDKDLWFASSAVATARERLLAMLEARGEVTLAGFRDELGCGRRSAQALLESFDREGLTRRRGDVRVLRTRR
jgi:selenocysteine-specific elongation factor